jgi:hypothetical protein
VEEGSVVAMSDGGGERSVDVEVSACVPVGRDGSVDVAAVGDFAAAVPDGVTATITSDAFGSSEMCATWTEERSGADLSAPAAGSGGECGCD